MATRQHQETTMNRNPLAQAAGAAACWLLLCTAVPAQTVGADRIARLDVAQLKTAYLACDEQASEHVLDIGSAMLCSQIAEALKQRAFDGDFTRLIEWWRVAKAERRRLASAR
jgi:hypothetical protein